MPREEATIARGNDTTVLALQENHRKSSNLAVPV
jgi:hypothetical protein